jgi:hypothetical protein
MSLDFVTVIFYTARLSALCPTPNLEDQVSVLMSPSDRVAQLYPKASGSLFVTYDLQGYSGSILTRHHSGPYYVHMEKQFIARLEHHANFC